MTTESGSVGGSKTKNIGRELENIGDLSPRSYRNKIHVVVEVASHKVRGAFTTHRRASAVTEKANRDGFPCVIYTVTINKEY